MTADVLVMGYGKMPAECARCLSTLPPNSVRIVETKRFPFSPLKATSQALGFSYSLSESPRDLADILKSVDAPTLVLSINNDFIFSNGICSKPNLRIANFHGSLLPKYRGHGDVLASWAIFNRETMHGGTWHSVSPLLDCGKILCQRELPVEANDTAIRLMMRVVKSGVGMFASHWTEFWDQCGLVEPSPEINEQIYRRRDFPNGGCFDQNWDFETAERFLRSMDTRPLNYLPLPTIIVNGNSFTISSYRTSQSFEKLNPGLELLDDGPLRARHVSKHGVIDLDLNYG
jgi:methionyl-tRNA formyltransferase